MRWWYCIFFLLLSVTGYAQPFDLIVTKSLDSIACRIDSITNDKVYFEFKNKGYWIHTNLAKESVVEYSTDIIDKTVVFKTGSSIILSPKNYNTKQAFYFEAATAIFWSTVGLNYEKVIWHANDYFHLNVRTGIVIVTTNGEGVGIPLNITVLAGKLKHYFELTAGYAPLLKLPISGDYLHFGIIGLGYRYQSPGGGPLYRLNIGTGGLGFSVGYVFN